jgi:hypothetical protein
MVGGDKKPERRRREENPKPSAADDEDDEEAPPVIDLELFLPDREAAAAAAAAAAKPAAESGRGRKKRGGGAAAAAPAPAPAPAPAAEDENTDCLLCCYGMKYFAVTECIHSSQVCAVCALRLRIFPLKKKLGTQIMQLHCLSALCSTTFIHSTLSLSLSLSLCRGEKEGRQT